jgi:hypothetical protein
MKECTLLDGDFQVAVQAALALSALAALVLKKMGDNRPKLVWAFDVSKQALAAAIQHAVNLLLGLSLARQSHASQCAWYLTNFALSVVAGILLITTIMRAYATLVERYGLDVLRSGEYGDPPQYRPWLAQLCAWSLVIVAEKVVVAGCVLLPLHGTLDELAASLEARWRFGPQLELLCVMVVAPGLLNAVYFVSVDSIIMGRSVSSISKRGGAGAAGLRTWASSEPSDARGETESESREGLLSGGDCGGCCPRPSASSCSVSRLV